MALTIRPPRTTWFQPHPRLCCSVDDWRDHFVRGGLDGSTVGSCALLVHLLCRRRSCPFPLAAAPVVGRVVAPAAAAFKLLPTFGWKCSLLYLAVAGLPVWDWLA
jgi:hypothetical protein